MSSIAIATSASITANAAHIQAQQAEKLACQSFIAGFDSKKANVESMQGYAKCVDIVFPKNSAISPEVIIALKICFAACLLCGFFNLWRENSYGYSGKVLDFLEGVFLSAISIFIAFLLGRGIYWVAV